MKLLSSVILMLGAMLICRGQDSTAVFDEFNFERGLSSNEVHSIAQDEDGFVWIGTADGLNRFDGNSFTQYFKSNSGLSENNVNDIACLGHHRIAIATSNGLNFFDSRRSHFLVFKTGDRSALADFTNDFIKLCVDRAGELWAVSQTDVYLFDSSLHLLKKFSGGFTPGDINKKRIIFTWNVTVLPDGKVLIQFSDHYSIYNTESARLETLNEKSSSRWAFVTHPEFSNIYCADRYGRFWAFQSRKDSIYQYNGDRNLIKSFPLFKGASNYFSYTANIFCTDSNHLIIQLPGRGFYEMSLGQDQPRISLLHNLPTPGNYCCYLSDYKNNFWVGTYRGLYQWSRFKNQFHANVFQNSVERKNGADVSFFLNIKNNLWIGSYGAGIYSYDTGLKTIQHYLFDGHLNEVWNITKCGNDTFWVGTQIGLLWFVPSNRTHGRLRCNHPPEIDSFPITTQFQDSRGNIWIGMGLGHGVACFSPTNNSFVIYDNRSSFPLRYPYAITEDEDGNLWMGNKMGGGLVKWERSSNMFTVINASGATDFSDSRINDLYADHRGHVWLATFLNGLIRYDITSGKFQSFGRSKGLSHECIYKIQPAEHPYLWLTTALGLNRFNYNTGSFEAFFKKDGLPTDELTKGSHYDASSGMMYLGMKSGFIQFDALHFSTSTALPKVVINKVIVNNQPADRDLQKPVVLKYYRNNLAISFTAVDLVDGSYLKFRYRLHNGSAWNDAGNSREINFSNLSPGNYSVAIEVANRAGIWNEEMTSLNFFIKPPFWNTTWFYIIIAVFVIAVAYLIYRFRIKQLQHVQEMRNRIASDLHDDIGGTITAMNLTNELALQHLNDPVLTKKLLADNSDDLKNVAETLDDIVWAVNPKNDSMREIMARMRRYASRTWEAAGIRFNFSFDDKAEVVRLNMEQRRDIYLVFKEGVSNVAKHSGCTHASSSLLLRDDSLVIEIQDNGQGFDVNLTSNRNGLQNIRTRIQKWRGECKIVSEIQKGTKVWLRMPVTQKWD